MTQPTFTADQRKRAISYFFGSAKSTDAEIAQATGLNKGTLLNAPLANGEKFDQAQGWFAVRTCSLDWRLGQIAPNYRENWSFWSGVIAGFWATGALDDATAA